MIHIPPPPFWPGISNSIVFSPFSRFLKNFLYLTKSQKFRIMNICIWFPLESLILNIFSHLCLLALLLIGIQYVSHWEWNWASLHISNLSFFFSVNSYPLSSFLMSYFFFLMSYYWCYFVGSLYIFREVSLVIWVVKHALVCSLTYNISFGHIKAFDFYMVKFLSLFLLLFFFFPFLAPDFLIKF